MYFCLALPAFIGVMRVLTAATVPTTAFLLPWLLRGSRKKDFGLATCKRRGNAITKSRLTSSLMTTCILARDYLQNNFFSKWSTRQLAKKSARGLQKTQDVESLTPEVFTDQGESKPNAVLLASVARA